MQKELRLSGSGGQGLILAGVILAEAALLDGKHAIQSQSYGPEARGGSSKAEVIISDGPIDFVKVQKCDMLLCLTQAAYDKYSKDYCAVLIVDDSININPSPAAAPEKVVKVPILESAAEKLGKPMVANIIALGVLNGQLSLVSKDSLKAAVLDRVPKGTEELNEQALEFGYGLGARD
ncbi:MAG: 2-oxoacid:acceptor oxidoreductase family protein [Clostridiales bacterium]|jgi:2-oxoglutarate ferredoxin oxidoreductase subunit gamma|nr:2-oxoacid:acceptor oxidoreductase family protein [Clostridiales bacterium]